MSSEALECLLRGQPGIWKGHRWGAPTGARVATGFPELDKLLPGGGWPLGALLEIQVPCLSVGELRLLLPAMRHISQAGRWVAWIAPPHRPYAPALVQAGIDLAQVLVVEAGLADIPWSLEQLLRGGHCGMALTWPRRLADHQTRRLQLAAEEGRALAALFLPENAGSPYAAVRLAVRPVDEGLAVDLLKVRGSLRRESVVLKG